MSEKGGGWEEWKRLRDLKIDTDPQKGEQRSVKLDTGLKKDLTRSTVKIISRYCCIRARRVAGNHLERKVMGKGGGSRRRSFIAFISRSWRGIGGSSDVPT